MDIAVDAEQMPAPSDTQPSDIPSDPRGELRTDLQGNNGLQAFAHSVYLTLFAAPQGYADIGLFLRDLRFGYSESSRFQKIV